MPVMEVAMGSGALVKGASGHGTLIYHGVHLVNPMLMDDFGPDLVLGHRVTVIDSKLTIASGLEAFVGIPISHRKKNVLRV
ncbi:hypothetical protein PanWU01x14_348190 [Parasponia andersonii]|uniref:Uncharacterized protein n=1 Tax=Parasponia andersonii TaxID=3476 RepID=A0A2P5ABT8_PARAD|nr:hypothetical protein PanWU01x14_348190 [Parasponia andersonii]